MLSIQSAFTGIVVCALCVTVAGQTTAPASGPATAPGDIGPLVVAATAHPAIVHPGDSFKLEVVIKNVSKEEQKIDVPNIVWAAAADVPQFTIPGWPARGGIGPVVIFRSVAIAPGDTFEHTWNANVTPAAGAGDVVFRVGVPLRRGGDKTWSEPLTVKIAAKEAKAAVANPLYNAWKGQETKTATFTREETISGGAPAPGGGQRAANRTTVSQTCAKITDEQAEIAMTVGDSPAQTLIIPANLTPDDPALPKAAGNEDIKIGEKTYTCTKYTYSTGSKLEMGRDGQGLRGQVTVWIAEGVPGGIVKRSISLTVRVTYQITDTLQPTK